MQIVALTAVKYPHLHFLPVRESQFGSPLPEGFLDRCRLGCLVFPNQTIALAYQGYRFTCLGFKRTLYFLLLVPFHVVYLQVLKVLMHLYAYFFLFLLIVSYSNRRKIWSELSDSKLSIHLGWFTSLKIKSIIYLVV